MNARARCRPEATSPANGALQVYQVYFHQRLLMASKPKRSLIVACMRKLLVFLNAMVMMAASGAGCRYPASTLACKTAALSR
jgi:hypothetical protein